MFDYVLAGLLVVVASLFAAIAKRVQVNERKHKAIDRRIQEVVCHR